MNTVPEIYTDPIHFGVIKGHICQCGKYTEMFYSDKNKQKTTTVCWCRKKTQFYAIKISDTV